MPEIAREPSCEEPVAALQENEIAYWLASARLNAAMVETSAAQIGAGVTGL
jgi:hypothetical protein